MVLIHGRGELSEGKLENLRNVIIGFDYGTGVRQYAIASPDFKEAIRTGQYIGVVPTYANNLSVSDINYILDQVEMDFPVDRTKEGLVGFSLGGGAVVRYITSSPLNAGRLAFAVAAAPVNWATDWKIVADARLQFIGITTEADKVVDPSNIKGMVDKLNSYNPAIKPKLIILPGDGHGGLNEIISLSHPLVPQTIGAYLATVSTADRKQYPTNTTTTPPTQPPTTTLTAIAKEIGITTVSTVTLDGSDSKGATGASWGCINVPAGVNPYTNFFPKGSGWYTVTATLPKEGAYTFVLNAYNSTATARDTIVVTYQKTTVPVPVVPMSYDSNTGYLVLSDGSRILATATVDFSTKKVTIKDQAGVVYTW